MSNLCIYVQHLKILPCIFFCYWLTFAYPYSEKLDNRKALHFKISLCSSLFHPFKNLYSLIFYGFWLFRVYFFFISLPSSSPQRPPLAKLTEIKGALYIYIRYLCIYFKESTACIILTRLSRSRHISWRNKAF